LSPGQKAFESKSSAGETSSHAARRLRHYRESSLLVGAVTER
jgi:hypothetical protein